MLVAVGPAVSVAGAITVVSLDGAAVAATQSQIAAFIGAATAADFSGNVLDVANDAPDSFPIGETLVTFTAVDADDRQGQNSSTVTVVRHLLKMTPIMMALMICLKLKTDSIPMRMTLRPMPMAMVEVT